MWTVVFLPYSLEPGEVGKPIAGEIIWQHKTAKAARRRLARLIKGDAWKPGSYYKGGAWRARGWYLAIAPNGDDFSLVELARVIKSGTVQ